MSSFGNWYDEKKAAENGDASSSNSSWFSIDTDEVLPLFNAENLQSFSFENMKQSMEGQMPKKIMGMGYQQRFQVIFHYMLGEDEPRVYQMFCLLLPSGFLLQIYPCVCV